METTLVHWLLVGLGLLLWAGVGLGGIWLYWKELRPEWLKGDGFLWRLRYERECTSEGIADAITDWVVWWTVRFITVVTVIGRPLIHLVVAVVDYFLWGPCLACLLGLLYLFTGGWRQPDNRQRARGYPS